MVKSYYVFTNLNTGVKSPVIHEGEAYKKAKEERNINIDARADNISTYNNYRITRFTSVKKATEFLNQTLFITKPIMISNKPTLGSGTTKTYRQSVLNVHARKEMAVRIERLVPEIMSRNAMFIYVRLTYVMDNRTKPMYKMYDVYLKENLDILLANLRNGKNIDFEQDDGTVVNYEGDGYFLDHTEFDLIFRADIALGVKKDVTDIVEIGDFEVEVISPPPKGKDQKDYNCLKELLCKIFKYRKQHRIIINKIIKSMKTTEQFDNEFKIILEASDIQMIETRLNLKTNFIQDINTDGSFNYYYESKSSNLREINFLLHDQHVYIILSIKEKNIIGSKKEILISKEPVNQFIYIGYDYESIYCCRQRKHVPSIICTVPFTLDSDYLSYKENKKEFINENCTGEMIKYYENLFPDYTRIYVGFNSSKFDVFFVINHLIRNDLRPKIKIYKDKLFVESDFNIFTDILPLLPAGTLQNLGKAFKTHHQKLKGDVSFHYHNYIYNSPLEADGSMNKYFDIIKTTLVDGSLTEKIYDRMINYCFHDVYTTIDLYLDYGRYVNNLLSVMDNIGRVYLSSFKTLGELSMTILQTLDYQKEHPEHKGFIKKSKKKQYTYDAIIKTDSVKHTTEIYKFCRQALIASISYAKRNTIVNDKLTCLIDVISLYPYVLDSDFKYGYGKLIPIEINEVIKEPINLGIYEVEVTFFKEKFQRIPFLGESYEWIHKETIRRVLYAQDINNLLKAGDVLIEVFHGYYFEKETTSHEIFGDYMRLFTKTKNQQDEYKEKNDERYNQGLRETCKAFMNILSGKLVQTYGYEHKLQYKYKSLEDCKTTDLVDGQIIDEEKFSIFKTDQKINSRREIYDLSLVGGQLYTYAREHMQKMLDKIFKLGYEPYVIETDSIILDRNFMLQDVVNSSKEYSGTIKDGKFVPNFKVFGQFDVENDFISELYVYGKKSYYFKYGDKDKFKFKGVSPSAIICNPKLEKILVDYNKMKSYYEQLFKNKIVRVEVNEDLTDANYLISNYVSHELQNSKNLLTSNPVNLFKNLIGNKEVTILQTIIKKHYARNSNQALTLENVIITKTFKQKVKKSESQEEIETPKERKVMERGYKTAFENIKKVCNVPMLINQLDN